MAEFFGDLERLVADLYPYRWPITAGVLVLLAATVVFGYRLGWHHVLWRRRVLVASIGVPTLVVLGIAGWYLGSPLFTNVTVDEEFPFAFAAEIPKDMTVAQVNTEIEQASKVEQVVEETMPFKNMEIVAASSAQTTEPPQVGATNITPAPPPLSLVPQESTSQPSLRPLRHPPTS